MESSIATPLVEAVMGVDGVREREQRKGSEREIDVGREELQVAKGEATTRLHVMAPSPTCSDFDTLN